MSEESVIFDRSGRFVTPKNPEESLKRVEDPYFVFILQDLQKIKRRSSFSVVNTNVFENIPKYPMAVISESEKLLTRQAFVKEVLNLLKTKKVAWIDTDVMSFDWAAIHSGNGNILSTLENSPIKKAYVSIQRDDGQNDYFSYTIVD